MQLEAIYVLNEIAEEFITKFHKETTQGHNRAIALVARLGQKYIIKNI